MTTRLEVWAVAAALALILFAPIIDPWATVILAAGLLGSLLAIELFESAQRERKGRSR